MSMDVVQFVTSSAYVWNLRPYRMCVHVPLIVRSRVDVKRVHKSAKFLPVHCKNLSYVSRCLNQGAGLCGPDMRDLSKPYDLPLLSPVRCVDQNFLLVFGSQVRILV